MPLHITAAKSSRVTKPRSANPLRTRSSTSAFSTTPRRKPSQPPRPKSTSNDEACSPADARLAATAVVRLPAAASGPRDVAALVRHISGRMFAAVPARAAGMTSTRTAAVLNFRASLPPIVTAAHVHALGPSPTAVERETAALARNAVLRKIRLPGRGAGDALVLVDDWVRLVQAHSHLDQPTKDKYTALLRAAPPAAAAAVPPAAFTPDERSLLVATGLLTAPTGSSSSATITSHAPALLPSGSSPSALGALPSLSRAGSQHASGTVAAVGGADALHASGGSGGGVLAKPGVITSSSSSSSSSNTGAARSTPLALSLPSVGPYLKLLAAARAHLLALLARGGPSRAAPLAALRDAWDGGVASASASIEGEGEGEDAGGGVGAVGAVAAAKRARGESAGALPGRTRKWRLFYGMRFEWVVEECVGAGLVECFETGGVGVGVRAVR